MITASQWLLREPPALAMPDLNSKTSVGHRDCGCKPAGLTYIGASDPRLEVARRHIVGEILKMRPCGPL